MPGPGGTIRYECQLGTGWGKGWPVQLFDEGALVARARETVTFPPPVIFPPGLDPDHAQRMREQMERTRRMMQEAMERSRQHQQRMLEMMRRNQNAFPAPAFPGMARSTPAPGRLGVQVKVPSPTLVDQLDLPKGQGLVIEEVLPESAAAKAGIKPHDVLLEVNGQVVSDDPAKFAKSVLDLPAKKAMGAVVLRKGKKETLKGLTLPERQAAAPDVPEINNFPIPALPRVELPRVDVQVPAFGGFNAFAGAGAGNVMTTTFRNRDRFTTRHQEGNLVITVTGKVATASRR
jgi:hypothetical protein